MPVPIGCPWLGRKLAREIKGDVFEGLCGLVFGRVFVGGSKLRRVAKALIPLDIPHLALGKENGVEDLECEAKTETKDRTSTLSRDKPKCHSWLRTWAISLDQMGYRNTTHLR